MHTAIDNTFAVSVSATQRLKWPQDNIKFNPEKPFLICGGGSNLLFLEPIYEGQLIESNNRLWQVETLQESFKVTLGAALNWHQCVKKLTEIGIGGVQNLALIPGTVGAAPVQNIGAYGVEISDYIDSVSVIDLRSQKALVLTKEQCQFAYRHSVFKQATGRYWLIDQICLQIPKSCLLKTHYGPLQKLNLASQQAVFDAVCDIRKKKLPDPAQVGNAGSFFKNPILSGTQLDELRKVLPAIPVFKSGQGYKVPAAYLIDQAGLKGFELGAARVHKAQPLVLTNTGGASGQDIARLAAEVRFRVAQKYHIELVPEVRFIGTQQEINASQYLDQLSARNCN